MRIKQNKSDFPKEEFHQLVAKIIKDKLPQYDELYQFGGESLIEDLISGTQSSSLSPEMSINEFGITDLFDNLEYMILIIETYKLIYPKLSSFRWKSKKPESNIQKEWISVLTKAGMDEKLAKSIVDDYHEELSAFSISSSSSKLNL